MSRLGASEKRGGGSAENQVSDLLGCQPLLQPVLPDPYATAKQEPHGAVGGNAGTGEAAPCVFFADLDQLCVCHQCLCDWWRLLFAKRSRTIEANPAPCKVTSEKNQGGARRPLETSGQQGDQLRFARAVYGGVRKPAAAGQRPQGGHGGRQGRHRGGGGRRRGQGGRGWLRHAQGRHRGSGGRRVVAGDPCRIAGA